MASTQDSSPASSEPPLPPGFKTIEAIQNLSSDEIRANPQVSVIGFLQDFREPFQTGGRDHKCTIRLKDRSTWSSTSGMDIVVFWPLKHMPKVSKSGDVVLVRGAKVQMYGGAVQLLANKNFTQFHILAASNVPREMKSTASIAWNTYGPPQGNSVAPNSIELAYIIWANSLKMDLDLPSDHEFQEKVSRSSNVKDKFSLLQDVQSGRFYNILGKVIKVYDNPRQGMSVYLSDYTQNDNFYNFEWNKISDGGDEYGYKKKKPQREPDKVWPGPYGKMTIQLTLYDAQAEYVREQVKIGQWVLMKNVQIKFGNMGGCLEGVLRGDRDKAEESVKVEIVEQSEDQDQVDPRLKEGVRRKREHEKKFKSQMQAIKDDEAGLGDKRKRDDDGDGDGEKKNNKQRRKEKRAAAHSKVAEAEAKARKMLDLNENSELYSNTTLYFLTFDVEPRKIFLDDGRDHISPFTNCKYRANVRVVDYFPHRIEDFAVGYRFSEYEMLSDYSGDEDTDREEDLRTFLSGKGFAKNTWEWRFALQVEDATAKDPKDRLWLVVDNAAAQGLLNLEEDATSLRGDKGDKNLLEKLKRQLDILWGDLEEQKSAKQQMENTMDPSSTFDSTASSPPRSHKAGDQPDADDSDDENTSMRRTVLETELQDRVLNGTPEGDSKLAPRNKPFTCCIKQYGVMVKEKNPSKANAGNGKRWKRIFGIFGTSIS
ncbi:Protection of telomeres protein [Lachnellula occidentalis]|uniref:Protection of telomeres protein 1 n=1 Tax=Lachnellula occidentalis TaxID=215460 RepID=A0A8H8REW7_9HELO|nr:Protection of telomeres protein [Lachnellula occidentalis]